MLKSCFVFQNHLGIVSFFGFKHFCFKEDLLRGYFSFIFSDYRPLRYHDYLCIICSLKAVDFSEERNEKVALINV